MSLPFTDNPAKHVVRLHWDTPVLKYLHEKYGVRYRYMGLPGVELIDVKLWKNMIDEVIAFEPPDKSADRRHAIVTLRRNLKLLDVPGIAYWGSMEEVVCQGIDYEGQPYSQEKIVTLYNLDFCNEIASEIETLKGDLKVMRFEAIRQVLRDQAECYRQNGGESYFILMLTFRNQIGARKIRKFLHNAELLSEAREFYERCHQLNPIPDSGSLEGTHPWVLKAYLYDWLCQNFRNPNLSALFFPIVLYNGTPIRGKIPSPMIHWLILCRFARPEDPSPSALPKPFLNFPSVAVGGIPTQPLIWKQIHGETSPATKAPNAVTWLTRHEGQFLKDL